MHLANCVISFTFDDFPRSAWHTGGAILRSRGLSGTYYASFGMMGTIGPTGELFGADDAAALVEEGHELGCHTFAHCDAWRTDTAVFERSVVRNLGALREHVGHARFRSLSYPVSPPRPGTKRAMAEHFECCRGGGQTFNVGTADRAYLAAFFLEQSRETPDAVKRVIDRSVEQKGWLIFATHDVCARPTPYGCTPSFFEEIVRYSVEAGARILPVVRAFRALTADG